MGFRRGERLVTRTRKGFSRPAARLLLIGQPMILLSLLDYAAAVYQSAAVGMTGFHFLIEDAGSAIGAGMAFLWGSALILDYMVKKGEHRE